MFVSVKTEKHYEQHRGELEYEKNRHDYFQQDGGFR
jgi:hypothetical protein